MKQMGSDAIFQELSLGFSHSSSYESAMEALSSLISRKKRGDGPNSDIKFERMHKYMKILDLGENIVKLNIIHIAGTKGKGSTCTFSEAILRECGFKTGLFTSPHLIDVRERYRIDGLNISEDKFLGYFWGCWNRLKEKVTDDLPMPPLFQFLTLLAFKIFINEKVDVAIVEVGLGGTTDSTNVIKQPVVCGITSLGMDHMETLGDTLGKIASQKAGILKPQIPAFSVPQLSEAMDVLKERAAKLKVPIKVALPLDPNTLGGIRLGLAGDHQFINAGLAIALCRSWLQTTGHLEKLFPYEPYLPEAFLRGLSTATLPGRAQIVYDTWVKSSEASERKNNCSGDLIFYFDGAHSPESMEVCARWFCNAVNEDKDSKNTNTEEFQSSGIKFDAKNFDGYNKTSKQILLFNCMDVRDPQILLPRLFNTCALSGKLLMAKYPSLFWTPCAAHCIDLILHDIGKLSIVKKTLKKAISLNGYIYNHPFVLNMMRSFTKQRELIRPAVTRFATAYLTLQSIHNQKNSLRAMFCSEEWLNSRYHRDTGGRVAYETVMQTSFWTNILYVLKVTAPIVRVLRLVDSEKKPAMGYIYEAMDRAKEAIKRSFNDNEAKYGEIWNIIDLRWNAQLHHPLHAAGYYLNPEFYYTTEMIESIEELNYGLMTTIEKLIPDVRLQDRIHQELNIFREAVGLMGSSTAIRHRTTLSPGVHFSKGLFVPNLSTYHKVNSSASTISPETIKDLSWQFTLQRTWEKIIRGKDVIEESSTLSNAEILPSYGFLHGDSTLNCNTSCQQSACGAVIRSLPTAIKWLRDCARENPSVRLQVLVTGSLHLVGDVLKLLKR